MENNRVISNIEIFAPRWSKNDVLVSTKKVITDGLNFIKFTKIKPEDIDRYSTKYSSQDADFFVNNIFVFEMDGEDFFPIESNNGLPCYAIPLTHIKPYNAIDNKTPYNIIFITKEQYEHYIACEAKLKQIDKILKI